MLLVFKRGAYQVITETQQLSMAKYRLQSFCSVRDSLTGIQHQQGKDSSVKLLSNKAGVYLMNRKITLSKVSESDIPVFIADIQKAFQIAYEQECGKSAEPVISEQDIMSSFSNVNSVPYFAYINNNIAGGCVVVVNPETKTGSLDLLYTKVGNQNLGIGTKIWSKIEETYPEIHTWETFTPYFDKRNIHFYINKLGFHIVEFYNQSHRMPSEYSRQTSCDMPAEMDDGFFRFVKHLK